MANQKKGQKVGRNAKWCVAYKSESKHQKSHIRRIKKHLARFGLSDKKAKDTLLWYAEGLGLNPLRSAQEFVSQLK